MSARSSLAWMLAAVMVATAGEPAGAQVGSGTGVDRALVIRFSGPQALEARDNVARGAGRVVEVVSTDEAERAARRVGVSLASPRGRRRVARALRARLVVFGRVVGTGCDATTEIVVEDVRGNELAREETAPPVGPHNERTVRDAAERAIRAALAVAPPLEEESAEEEEAYGPEQEPVAEAEPEPEPEEEPWAATQPEPEPAPEPIASSAEEPEPEPAAVTEAEPEPEPAAVTEAEPEAEPAAAEEEPAAEEVSEEAETREEGEERSPTPVAQIFLGLGGRDSRLDVNLQNGNTRRADDAGTQGQLGVRAEFRPLGRSVEVAPRGLYLRLEFGAALGLKTTDTATGTEYDTGSYQVAAHAGYAYPFHRGQLGALVGYQVDLLNLPTNPAFPSSALHELRFAGMGIVDIVRERLALTAELGIGPVLSVGDLDAFGSDNSGFGLDTLVGLEGALDVGFAYRAEFRLNYYGLDFGGTASGGFPPARDADGLIYAVMGYLGWRFY